MNIDWPYVRQIIINDRVNGYKLDKECINKLARLLPDCKILGFGRYYQYHWYVLVESRVFPYSIEDLPARGAIPLTSVYAYLPKISVV